MSYYFKTQDVIEFKPKQSTLPQEPKLSGYLQKRDPSGFVKGWKKRYFFLQVRINIEFLNQMIDLILEFTIVLFGF